MYFKFSELEGYYIETYIDKLLYTLDIVIYIGLEKTSL